MLTNRRHNQHRSQPRALFGNLIAYMKRRLEEQPSDVKLHLSLVSHLKMAGRYTEAIRQAEHLLRRNPNNRRAKTLLLRLRLERRLSAIQRGLL